MENFHARKKDTIERCRQIQVDTESNVLETQRLKEAERNELYEQEKRKIQRKHDEKIEVSKQIAINERCTQVFTRFYQQEFEERHEHNRQSVEKYYQKIGNLTPNAYTPAPLSTSKLDLSFHTRHSYAGMSGRYSRSYSARTDNTDSHSISSQTNENRLSVASTQYDLSAIEGTESAKINVS